MSTQKFRIERDPLESMEVRSERKRVRAAENYSRYLRHKKTVLALAALAIVYTLTGLRIEEISVLGTKVVVENPWAVKCALWVALIYFALLARMYLRRASPTDHRSLVYSRLAPTLGNIAAQRYRKLIVEEYGEDVAHSGSLSIKLAHNRGLLNLVRLKYTGSYGPIKNTKGKPLNSDHHTWILLSSALPVYLWAQLRVSLDTPSVLEERLPFALFFIAAVLEFIRFAASATWPF